MAEYIDREYLQKRLEHDLDRWIDSAAMYTEDKPGVVALREALREVLMAPTADVAKIVRCKDCKWYEPENSVNPPFCNHPAGVIFGGNVGLFFCAYGEGG